MGEGKRYWGEDGEHTEGRGAVVVEEATCRESRHRRVQGSTVWGMPWVVTAVRGCGGSVVGGRE